MRNSLFQDFKTSEYPISRCHSVVTPLLHTYLSKTHNGRSSFHQRSSIRAIAHNMRCKADVKTEKLFPGHDGKC